MNRKFYVTTPIFYVNARPHVGHVYTSFVADTLARYHRMLGHDVFFLTGTDENSQKNLEAAEKAGKGEDLPGYLDEMAALWQGTFDSLGLTHDRFVRTTEPDHLKAVEKFWKIVEASGDIYEGEYEGPYCTGCEEFKAESDLVDGNCPIHKTPCERLKETNFFFRLIKYRDALLEHIGKHPEFILPETRRNEVVSYIRDFMTDISVTRRDAPCGIPVPGNPEHKIYVWFDALINYLSGSGYATDEKAFAKWWPADLHLVGKDIIKFHCALWPAMLMSAGLPLPKQVFAHGFFTVDGDKISKSLGNAIDPVIIAEEYGIDTLRYFLLREIRLGEDGDFSHERLADRYGNDLADELGNLVHRVLTMAEKYLDGKVPARAAGFLEAWPAYESAMDEMRLHDALEIAWQAVRESNRFIEQQQPWQLAKMGEEKMLADALYILLETLRHIAWMLYPFLPDTSERLFGKLGLPNAQAWKDDVRTAWAWGGLEPGGTITKGEPLFPRKEQ